MLRIDLFSFGGGLATMPIMYHEFVDLYGWFDKQTFMDVVIPGQVTTGVDVIEIIYGGVILSFSIKLFFCPASISLFQISLFNLSK